MRLLLTSRAWRVVLVCLRSISVSVIINYTNMAATSHVKLDLIFENIALFVYIYRIAILNAVLRIFWRNTRKFFPAEPFFCMSCIKCLSKCPYSKKPVLPQKTPGYTLVTLNLTFHPNFHPNILVFANLPVHRKLIHDNI